jgi:hypothetical protein
MHKAGTRWNLQYDGHRKERNNEKLTRVSRRDIRARYLSLTTKHFKDRIIHIQQSLIDMNPRSATSINIRFL